MREHTRKLYNIRTSRFIEVSFRSFVPSFNGYLFSFNLQADDFCVLSVALRNDEREERGLEKKGWKEETFL